MSVGAVVTFTCDRCGAEHTGDYGDLFAEQGWVRHAFAFGGFLMCGDCEALFVPIWAAHAAAVETTL